LSLVGCGGDDSTGQDATGLLAVREDTTAKAKQGGTLKWFRTGEVTNFAPPDTSSDLNSHTLVKLTVGVATPIKTWDGTRQGDLSESWETTDDGLTWTFKLRPDAIAPNLPSGRRAMDAQDVLASVEWMKTFGEYRKQIFNLGPAGPVSSVTAPDDRTIVMKLDFPFQPLLAALDYFYIRPRDAVEEKYDQRAMIYGAGPFMVESYQPGTHLYYTRNPEWHFKGRPFVDRIEQPILPEYATRVSQFRAGVIHAGVLRQEEIIPTKREMPQLNLVTLGLGEFTCNDDYHLMFGLRPNSPFRDERVRQACSMSIDRDTWLDTFYNTQAFRDEGLEVEVRYYSHLGAGQVGEKWWLNPQDPKFGPNAKYLMYDPAEAKKLASAAGVGPGYSMVFHHRPSGMPNEIATVVDMIKENLGWEVEELIVAGTAGPLSPWLDKMGDFEDGFGITCMNNRPDPALYYYHKYTSKAYSEVGGTIRLPVGIDPEMDRRFDEQLSILDEEKRIEAVHDLQRYLAKSMLYVPFPGAATKFDVAWPDLKNYGVFNRSDPSTTAAELRAQRFWLDQSASRSPGKAVPVRGGSSASPDCDCPS
jgi:peptide/nickel transport system substrate-binding protein